MFKSPFLLLLVILCFSCSKSDEFEANPVVVEDESGYLHADERLWPFFRSFENEALKRGFVFDLNQLNIRGLIAPIDESGVAGICRYGSHIHNEVTISEGFWNRASDQFREFVVFHELGHCVLMRDHDETILNNGNCQSIMRSGVQNCRDNYNSSTRSSYLDELFYEGRAL